MSRAGVSILGLVIANMALANRTTICTSAGSCTNKFAHFCCSKIRNGFFVQAEFFDLLFHFVLIFMV